MADSALPAKSVNSTRFEKFMTVGSFLLHGGASIVNVIVGFWLIKYLWGWKMISSLPSFGAGPTTEGGSTKWVLYGVLIVMTAIIANLAFADFRNKPTAWVQMASSGWVLGVCVVGEIAYIMNSLGGLTLTDVQAHVLHAFFWTGLLAVMTGLVALRLNRLYFGDVAGGQNR